jgi:hypothetical protein
MLNIEHRARLMPKTESSSNSMTLRYYEIINSWYFQYYYKRNFIPLSLLGITVSLMVQRHEATDEGHDLYVTVSCDSRQKSSTSTYQTSANIDNILGYQEDQSIHLTSDRDRKFS